MKKLWNWVWSTLKIYLGSPYSYFTWCCLIRNLDTDSTVLRRITSEDNPPVDVSVLPVVLVLCSSKSTHRKVYQPNLVVAFSHLSPTFSFWTEHFGIMATASQRPGLLGFTTGHKFTRGKLSLNPFSSSTSSLTLPIISFSATPSSAHQVPKASLSQSLIISTRLSFVKMDAFILGRRNYDQFRLMSNYPLCETSSNEWDLIAN